MIPRRVCGLLTVCVLTAVSCGRPENKTEGAPQAASTNRLAAVGQAIGAAEKLLTADPATPLVTVNERTLTVDDARRMVDNRLQGEAGRFSPEGLQKRRAVGLLSMIEQFVTRSLLLDEAARRGVAPTEEEIKAAMAKVQSKLPDGMTVEEFMRKSTMGEAWMRRELIEGLTVEKLISQAVPRTQTVDAQELEAFLAGDPAARVPPTATLRHIMLRKNAADDDAAVSAKKAKIGQIRSRILEGMDFVTMAGRFSEDKDSAANGGLLGTFSPTQFGRERALEAAAFSQPTGQVGEVVETSAGYHIVRVESRSESRPLPRARAENVLKARKDRAAYEAFVKSLREKATVKFGEGVPALDL
jgi:parvulin-like peptidyl-prolyl isomerase